MIKIISWNINGIRACSKKEEGLPELLKSHNPDILAFQETKIQEKDLSDQLALKHRFKSTWAFSTIKKGYSGVAILTKPEISIISEKSNIDIKKFDQEGRTTIQEFGKFFLINGYYPNGQDSHARVPFKLEYSEEILKFAKKLRKETGKGIILCGDFNTAHTEIDLARPKQNKNSTGFLPVERKFLDKLEKNSFIDLFRHFHKDQLDQYSWWSYRGGARSRNVGWRIDYFFATEDLLPYIKDCIYLDQQMGSDHCPVQITLDPFIFEE